MKQQTVKILSKNSPVLIGRFMLIFSRKKIEVLNYSFSKVNDEDGLFTIDFLANDWDAENVQKQLNKQIDIYEISLN
ncbi:MAG: hypothetical protein LC105_09090 [Chitinophagales bacterium]|nr:hypothetical protein [Chitinophagales bacterium]MCZ2393997.1 hypothetical protein [Chitinophagales bacterium]